MNYADDRATIEISDVVHPELVSAQRAIALAPADEKLGAIESEALRLSSMTNDELARGDAADVLLEAAKANGLSNTKE